MFDLDDNVLMVMFAPVFIVIGLAFAGVALLFGFPFLVTYGVAYVAVGQERAARFTWYVVTAALLVICALQVVIWVFHPAQFFLWK